MPPTVKKEAQRLLPFLGLEAAGSISGDSFPTCRQDETDACRLCGEVWAVEQGSLAFGLYNLAEVSSMGEELCFLFFFFFIYFY